MLVGGRLILACWLMLCVVATSGAQMPKVFAINLEAQSVADALNSLSEQTGTPVVFSYDLVRNRKANPVKGRYTLRQALNALLQGTGLSGGLSEKGVLTVSASNPPIPQPGESLVISDNNNSNTNRKTTAHKAGIAALLASIGAAFSVSAAEDTGDAAPNNFSEVVVTAQKKEERLLDTPVPVSVISAASLTENNQVLLRDYYSSVPGLNIQADIVNQQEVSIRGITTGGTGSAVVGIMVDGIPVGGSYTQTGDGFVPDFDPGDLQRVEVLRGPQGTLYGASSMGGLVNFVTVDPSTDRFSGRVAAGYSSVYNGAEPGFNVRASANIPVTDHFAIRMSGFSRQDPGYIDNPTLDLKGVNEAQADGARLAALWTPTDTMSLKISALYQYYKQDAASDVVMAPGLGPWQQNYIAQYGGANQKSDQVYSAILKLKLGNTTLTSDTGYSINRSYTTLDFGYVFGKQVQQMFGVTGAPYIQHDTPKRFTEELRLAGSVSKVDWLLGAYYSHEHSPFFDSVYASNAVTGQIAGLYYPFENPSPRTGEEYAGFANLNLHVTDQFDVQFGGRESHLSLNDPPYSVTGGVFGSATFTQAAQSASNSVFTYSVTPQFKISSDLMVYAKASSGFRPGYGNSQTAALGAGIPPQVAPDKTKDYELGAKGAFFDQTLTLDGSLYYIDWKNIQITLQSNDLTYHTNGSAAKSEGVELSATVRPFNGLTIEGWIDYDNAVLTEPFPPGSTATTNIGDRLPITPRRSGYLSATQEFALGSNASGFVGADVSFVGDRFGNFSKGARAFYPSYTKTDIRTGVRSHTWEVNLYANNVGNERGVLGGGIGYDPPNAFVYITPRTFGINVAKTF